MPQNAADRLRTETKRREHITPVLAAFHWLQVEFRIHYKICRFLLYQSLHSEAPEYISDLFLN